MLNSFEQKQINQAVIVSGEKAYHQGKERVNDHVDKVLNALWLQGYDQAKESMTNSSNYLPQ